MLMKLDDLEVYQISMDLAEKTWTQVIRWSSLQRNTVGTQLVRSMDSIAANISEGYGRYHYKENRHFCYIARGSLFETATWIKKAFNRQFISESDYHEFVTVLRQLSVKLNNYIKSIGRNTNTVKEPPETYPHTPNPDTDLDFLDNDSHEPQPEDAL